MQVTAIKTTVLKKEDKTIRFRWGYVALPLMVLFIAIIIVAVFYGRLPGDTAYRFSGGEVVSWVGRGAFLAWGLGLQLVFVLLALALTLLITTAARRIQISETALNRMVFRLIGNIIALPQIIIAYAMLDIILYNIYAKTLVPLWAFAIIVMFTGGVVLAIMFTRLFMQSRRLNLKN
jgi:hypothetical protein